MYITILNNMNVLSLFDGMSCGQIALKESGINVDKYFASEIDKYAISQTQTNFPDTIQLGDVTKISARDLPVIDLLIGGSPCQGFSFAGKQLNFDDPRSVLFFEYVRILKEIREKNPNVKFLLENVRMKKECERVISEILGVQPVVINSALVSAQNRVRLYWSNIRTQKEGLFGELYTDIPQPEDRNIFLKDILEPSVDEKYFLSDKVVSKLLEHKERHKKTGNGFGAVFHNESGKIGALTVGGKGMYDLVCVAMRGREECLFKKRTEDGKSIRKITGRQKNMQQLEPRSDGKTNTLTTVHKDNLIFVYQRQRGKNNGGLFIEKTPTISANAWEQNNLVLSGTFRTHKDDYGFREIKSGKAATIPARAREDGGGQNITMIGKSIRRLTHTECSRLQTIPDWYVWKCSDTQIYRMLGNGWTVEVIKHILSFLI
nr:MAG TPA: Cytosine specific methyltransferase [Caudoviricetes sp.]